jgi:RimJ/RimL family protein N-acetyltransferase
VSALEIACRVAVPGDWERIWPVVSAVLASGDTYAYPPDSPEEVARSWWMLPGSGRAWTFVAERDGTVVGSAYLKPNQPGLGDHVANAGWMVAPEAQGSGVGRRLATHVLDRARDAGYLGMQFNSVVATNAGAIALWESLGFRIVGTVPRAFRHPTAGLTAVHVMYRDL